MRAYPGLPAVVIQRYEAHLRNTSEMVCWSTLAIPRRMKTMRSGRSTRNVELVEAIGAEYASGGQLRRATRRPAWHHGTGGRRRHRA